MSTLSLEQQSAIIAALCDGVSIRGTARLTNCHRDSVMRLGLRVGQGCTAIHGRLVKGLTVKRIELDEMWSFVGKKRKNVTKGDGDKVGDQFVFLAMDSAGKAILSWLVGKRTSDNTQRFIEDVRYRVNGYPEFSTDGFQAYAPAIDLAFENSAHGIVDKKIVMVAGGPTTENGYVRGATVEIERTAAKGTPQRVSTSFIERQNLTLRMAQRRFTRRTNAFSKRYDHHCAAVALYAVHYNFCRVHEALRVTPAMQLGIADHIWTLEDLVKAALSGEIQEHVGRYVKGFRVLDGGKA